MDDLIEETGPAGDNAPPLSVSELSGALKRVVEGAFGRVRVRGELGRVVLARSGHLYFDLKDAGAVLAAVSWKGQAARLAIRPEEGMEVIATGRLTTFPGQSRYQLIVEALEPAGIGALMAMLEARRAKLAAEGLFDAARKKPLPFLPGVIGVITSPTGAVIRDILHRLRDRFPRHVLIWPVAVQGERCAPEVAAAIRGFNALPPGGPVPRPDLIIVARGGGSVEDLWGFNDEAVVRAAAASAIPLISAVGHETDTTLVDHAADVRAPTPTAAAELAVPVRAELRARVAELEARRLRGMRRVVEWRGQRLGDLARAMPRPADLAGRPAQRLDSLAARLAAGLRVALQEPARRLARQSGALRPPLLAAQLRAKRSRMEQVAGRIEHIAAMRRDKARGSLAEYRASVSQLQRTLDKKSYHLKVTSINFSRAVRAGQEARRTRLAGLERLRLGFGYVATLRRGYAVVRDGDGRLVTRRSALPEGPVELEFHDGRAVVPPPGDDGPGPAKKPQARRRRGKPEQGSLF